MASGDRIQIELSGGCQCGAVRYHATERLNNAHICHCRMCQKATGNFFAPLVGLPLDVLAWTRGKPSVFMSSAEVERGFCSQCGTPLFFHHLDGGHVSVTIGSLDHPELVVPRMQLGNESRLPYFTTLHEMQAMGTTEEEDPEGVAEIRRTNHQHPDHDTTDWTPHPSSL